MINHYGKLKAHLFDGKHIHESKNKPGAWVLPLERGVMEIGAGKPGMLRGNELITFGPGLELGGLPTICGAVEDFIFIGGGTKTVRT